MNKPVIIKIERNKGSKFKPKWPWQKYNNKTDEAKHEARKYLLFKYNNDDNFVGDAVYDAIGQLDDKFLEDPQIAAGLGLISGEISVQIHIIDKMEPAPPEFFNYLMREIINIANFYGRKEENYENELREMIDKIKDVDINKVEWSVEYRPINENNS